MLHMKAEDFATPEKDETEQYRDDEQRHLQESFEAQEKEREEQEMNDGMQWENRNSNLS